MSGPTITVIMPNFNDAPMIPGAIQGVLNQTRLPDEIIVVDDGSTDDSLAVISEWAGRNPRIRVLVNDSNVGVVHTFNRAIAESTTSHLCFVSMDDLNSPTWLQKSMGMLERYPQAGLCFSDLHFFRTFPQLRWRTLTRLSQSARFFTPMELADTLDGRYISGTTVVVRKDAFVEAGGYLPDLKWHSDWFGWLVVALRYGACYIPEPLVSLKVRRTSHSTVGVANLAAQREVIANLLRTATSHQFEDVLPLLVRSRALRTFREQLTAIVLTDPELWNPQSAMILLSALPDRAGLVGQMSAQSLREGLEWFVLKRIDGLLARLL